jgi:hypothetical protein
MAKLHESGYVLLSHPPHLFADLKRMFAGKKLNTYEEVIAETKAYFEAKEKSFYKNGSEKLCDRYNRCELFSPTVIFWKRQRKVMEILLEFNKF